tara:strand:- start:556 stop:1017 length:462 start_codon:yes stop_codon:yes gene_type:complete
MKIFIKSILFIFIITNVSFADLIKPEPKLKPLDVLLIQLNSLKNNNTPYMDAGIEQTWEFAHPNNKKITGPLSRFKQMIYSESYKILISHENSEITTLKETENIFVYKVTILSKDKKKYYYIWQIEKNLIDGNLKNCWMTTRVSNPEFLGEVI